MVEIENKMHRPFCTLKLTGIDESLTFHMEDTDDSTSDRRYSHLTDFEFLSGGSNGAEAKFTLIDIDRKLSQKLIPATYSQVDNIAKEGGPEVKQFVRDMKVEFQYGWHNGGSAGTPWTAATGITTVLKSPKFTGVLRGVDLNYSDGIFTYTLTVGGATDFVDKNIIPSSTAPGDKEYKIVINSANFSAKNLLDKIIKRVDLKVTYLPKAEEILSKSILKTDYIIYKGMRITECIKNICTAHTERQTADTPGIWEVYPDITKGGDHLIVAFSTNEEAKVAPEIRKYTVGIHKGNSVISFSPKHGKLIYGASMAPEGGVNTTSGDSIVKGVGEDPTKKNVAHNDSRTIDVSAERQPNKKPKHVAASVISQQALEKEFWLGTTAELVIFGDPGLYFIGENGTSGGPCSGKIVKLLVKLLPYVKGPAQGLTWASANSDDGHSGKYMITGVRHSLGVGKPYETSLELSKTDGLITPKSPTIE